MRLLNWNIRHGGGQRRRTIIEAACSHDADVLVLTEYRSAPKFLEWFAAFGYAHALTSDPAPRMNGIAILSKTSLETRPVDSSVPTAPKGRWLEAWLPAFDVHLVAIYLPGKTSPTGLDGKRAFWAAIHLAAEQHRNERAMIVGDLNTGAHHLDEERATFACAQDFVALEQTLRWRDAWRLCHGEARDYSWWSRGKGGRVCQGYRLDHIFVSPLLQPAVVTCDYFHDVRISGTSDHAAQLLVLGDSTARPSQSK